MDDHSLSRMHARDPRGVPMPAPPTIPRSADSLEAMGGRSRFHPHRADDRFLPLGSYLDRDPSLRLSQWLRSCVTGVRQRTFGKGSKRRVARVRWSRRYLMRRHGLWFRSARLSGSRSGNQVIRFEAISASTMCRGRSTSPIRCSHGIASMARWLRAK